MNEFDRNDMKRMQKEAEERLKEMQRKSNYHINNAMPPTPNFVKINQKEVKAIPPTPTDEIKPAVKNNNFGGKFLNILNLNNLKMDNDIIIILMLILLLSANDTDEILLLALVYIML